MTMSPPYSSGDGLPATRRGEKRTQVRVGASPCMYAGIYIICNVCMYGMANL